MSAKARIKNPGPPIVDDQNAMTGDAKCPFSERCPQARCGWNSIERKLVAESTESSRILHQHSTLQSHG